jgi:peroxiredoxin
MIRKLLYVLLASVLLTACEKKGNTIIEGVFHDGSRKMLFLDYLNINETVGVDSLKLTKQGEFRFKLDLTHPGIYLLRNDTGAIISLLPSPGEHLFIESSYPGFGKSYTVAGSPESENIRQLSEKLNDTRANLRKLDDAVSTLPSLSEEQASEYFAKRNAIISDQKSFTIQFIISNLKSLSGIYAIYQTLGPEQYVLNENRDIQYMKILADSLSLHFPDVPLVKAFVADARTTEKNYYDLKSLSEKIKEAKTGLPDLRLPDLKGDTISLSSLKPKVTLLLFWGSLNEDSRALIPSLMATYDKYHKEGFEVYAVSLDNNREYWERAVRYFDTRWINVSELSYPESKAAILYNVSTIPSSFLINRQGEIVARDLYGRELDKWLDNILK